MKLLKRCVYALLFMGVSLTVNASDEPSVSIRSQKGQTFSLHLKSMNNETHHIKISDKKGFVLLDEKVKHEEDYLKLFNLKNLPAGNYWLRIENDKSVVLQEINISEQKLTVDPANKKEILKPAKAKMKTAGQQTKMRTVNDKAIANRIKWLNGQNN